ncbi:hypothetical protein ACH5RR_027551 [Cinchona calisaya]|uniref:DUF4283 domain-containing protein n=1 Tax=Cinchona calisaya TaxID=153742 RepID=A0ABD2Z6W6_9GENT
MRWRCRLWRWCSTANRYGHRGFWKEDPSRFLNNSNKFQRFCIWPLSFSPESKVNSQAPVLSSIAKELDGLSKKLRITEAEDEDIIVSRPVQDEIMRNIWKPSKGIQSSVLGGNLILFQFFSKADLQRVLEGAPWDFDKNLLILKEYVGNVQPSKIQFDTCPFWVRIFNLPYNRMEEDMGKFIGNKLGTTVLIDVNNEGIGWREFLQRWTTANKNENNADPEVLVIQGPSVQVDSHHRIAEQIKKNIGNNDLDILLKDVPVMGSNPAASQNKNVGSRKQIRAKSAGVAKIGQSLSERQTNGSKSKILVEGEKDDQIDEPATKRFNGGAEADISMTN